MVEQELFDYLRSSLYPDLEKSVGIYDSFDCVSQKAGHYIELKCRRTHYPTLLIEEMKYRKLITQAAERDLIPFYINSTPEGIFGFDLTRVPEPAWEERFMPRTTEFANRDKITKVVGFLHLDYALVL